MSPEHRRLTYALLLSLLLHALLLGLSVGGEGAWIPRFGFPWLDRRIKVPDLRVLIVPEQVIAAAPAPTQVAPPPRPARVERLVAVEPALAPSASRAPAPQRTAAAIVPEAMPSAAARSTADAATGVAAAPMPLRADPPDDTGAPPTPAPAVMAVPRTDEGTWVMPITPAMPTPVIATEPSAASPDIAMPTRRDAGDAERARIDQDARERAVELSRLESSKQERQRQVEQAEAARQDAARQEASRAENVRLEVERQETARQAAARQLAAQQEAARLEAERQGTDLQEVARNAAKRQEAARVEAARVEAARVEAARVETARVEAARVEAARVDAARVDAAQEAAARREAALRAIGRQLDEEAARRDAATAAARQLPLSSGIRRYRLLGRTDPNAELILYAEAFGRKIHANMTFDMVREAVKLPHADPMVTVALRSDGSVESVTFVQSSGVAAIDDAIRRVVHSQAPYQVFPPGLAREFDVVEIRRTWYFDVAIRLY